MIKVLWPFLDILFHFIFIHVFTVLVENILPKWNRIVPKSFIISIIFLFFLNIFIICFLDLIDNLLNKLPKVDSSKIALDYWWQKVNIAGETFFVVLSWIHIQHFRLQIILNVQLSTVQRFSTRMLIVNVTIPIALFLFEELSLQILKCFSDFNPTDNRIRTCNCRHNTSSYLFYLKLCLARETKHITSEIASSCDELHDNIVIFFERYTSWFCFLRH